MEAALDLLDEAKRVYVRNPVPDLRPIEVLKAQVYLKQGRLTQSQDWARERGLSADDELSYLREFEHLTLAMSNTDRYRSAAALWVAPLRAQVRPVSGGYFAGMLDFSKLPLNWDTLKLRATVAFGIFPKGDRRDWNAIRAWARKHPPATAPVDFKEGSRQLFRPSASPSVSRHSATLPGPLGRMFHLDRPGLRLQRPVQKTGGGVAFPARTAAKAG